MSIKLPPLVKGSVAARYGGVSRQLQHKWVKEGSFPPPTAIISTIAYWKRDIVIGFFNGSIERDALENWIDKTNGTLVPYTSDPTRQYGYVPTLPQDAIDFLNQSKEVP